MTHIPPERLQAQAEIEEQELSIDDWKREFDEIQKNPPAPEDVILAEDYKEGPTEQEPHKGRIKLDIDLQVGRPPFIFARIFIPLTVGKRPAWYAQGLNNKVNYGWKAILHQRSRDQVIHKFGVTQSFITVKKLRVIRRSETGQSLVVEIEEW
jgi:hypothetical protein